MSDRGERGADEPRSASMAETAVIVVSVSLTVLLFAYAGWQVVTPPRAETPQASVVGTDPVADGRVAVIVRLENPKDVGFVSVTVESDCTSPPAQLEFAYVPASSSVEGTVVCPPGTTDPSVSVTSWVGQ